VASGVTYPGNAEFGEPTDADASDDFIVHHEQFTASYNPTRGGPNWVSYDLDARTSVPKTAATASRWIRICRLRSRASPPTTTPAPVRPRDTVSIAAT
jgi:DNA/RNA endonuclease G (NUC1)